MNEENFGNTLYLAVAGLNKEVPNQPSSCTNCYNAIVLAKLLFSSHGVRREVWLHHHLLTLLLSCIPEISLPVRGAPASDTRPGCWAPSGVCVEQGKFSNRSPWELEGALAGSGFRFPSAAPVALQVHWSQK